MVLKSLKAALAPRGFLCSTLPLSALAWHALLSPFLTPQEIYEPSPFSPYISLYASPARQRGACSVRERQSACTSSPVARRSLLQLPLPSSQILSPTCPSPSIPRPASSELCGVTSTSTKPAYRPASSASQKRETPRQIRDVLPEMRARGLWRPLQTRLESMHHGRQCSIARALELTLTSSGVLRMYLESQQRCNTPARMRLPLRRTWT